jgi:hypothetical protein
MLARSKVFENLELANIFAKPKPKTLNLDLELARSKNFKLAQNQKRFRLQQFQFSIPQPKPLLSYWKIWLEVIYNKSTMFDFPNSTTLHGF